jgi:hypothetical protein
LSRLLGQRETPFRPCPILILGMKLRKEVVKIIVYRRD